MRNKLKTILALLLVAAISFGGAGMLFARDGRETIEVIYRNIKLKVQSVDVPVTAENEPFIYEGRTYVPLRVVSEALGYDVEWDGANFTVSIGEAPGEVFLSELKPFHTENLLGIKYDDAANMIMDGKRYYNGIRIDAGHYDRQTELLFSLDAKYSLLTGLAGLDDSSSRNYESLVISFYGDDKFLTSVDLKKEQPKPLPLAIDRKGVLVLKIVINIKDAGWYGEILDLANMALVN